jgi:hypothetical protein
MKVRGYRISIWGKLALVALPFAVAASVFAVAALEHQGGTASGLHEIISELWAGGKQSDQRRN